MHPGQPLGELHEHEASAVNEVLTQVGRLREQEHVDHLARVFSAHLNLNGATGEGVAGVMSGTSKRQLAGAP